MRSVLRELMPNKFEDIIAVVALYRPGPMEQIPVFVQSKHGRKEIKYAHPILEPILNETYGVIVYQEQIMEIAARMAGFTLGQADLLRRAIGKKKKDILDQQQEMFIEGCLKNGYSRDLAIEIYDLILKFASYGFNKSHSVAYATLTYQMAYLKTYFPLVFYAAILNSSAHSSDTKLLAYLDELRQLKIQLAPPSIQTPSLQFSIVNQQLIAPLTLLKGIQPDLVKQIIHVRQQGPFRDFFDCVIRLHPLGMTANQHLACIDAGAYDGFQINRATLRASLPNAMKNAAIQATFLDEQTGLLPETSLPKMPLVEAADSHFENLEKELDVTGMILSQSVLGQHRFPKGEAPITTIQETKLSKQSVTTGGLIRQLRIIKTKAGQTMAFATIYDETDSLELIIFPKLYERMGPQLLRGQLVIVSGTLDQEKDHHFLVDQLRMLKLS
jgi:DNA polymerase-3 subunit alpha